jgi:hypothetical protein
MTNRLHLWSNTVHIYIYTWLMLGHAVPYQLAEVDSRSVLPGLACLSLPAMAIIKGSLHKHPQNYTMLQFMCKAERVSECYLCIGSSSSNVAKSTCSWPKQETIQIQWFVLNFNFTWRIQVQINTSWTLNTSLLNTNLNWIVLDSKIWIWMVCFELAFFMSNSNSNSKQTTAQKLLKVNEDDYTRRYSQRL